MRFPPRGAVPELRVRRTTPSAPGICGDRSRKLPLCPTTVGTVSFVPWRSPPHLLSEGQRAAPRSPRGPCLERRSHASERAGDPAGPRVPRALRGEPGFRKESPWGPHPQTDSPEPQAPAPPRTLWWPRSEPCRGRQGEAVGRGQADWDLDAGTRGRPSPSSATSSSPRCSQQGWSAPRGRHRVEGNARLPTGPRAPIAPGRPGRSGEGTRVATPPAPGPRPAPGRPYTALGLPLHLQTSWAPEPGGARGPLVTYGGCPGSQGGEQPGAEAARVFPLAPWSSCPVARVPACPPEGRRRHIPRASHLVPERWVAGGDAGDGSLRGSLTPAAPGALCSVISDPLGPPGPDLKSRPDPGLQGGAPLAGGGQAATRPVPCPPSRWSTLGPAWRAWGQSTARLGLRDGCTANRSPAGFRGFSVCPVAAFQAPRNGYMQDNFHPRFSYHFPSPIY